MKGSHFLMLLVIAFIFLGSSFFFFLGKVVGPGNGLHRDDGNIAVIEINGEITSSKKALELFEDVSKKDSVKAVLLRIDSPGGVIGAAQEIYEGVKKLKEKKPVIASMGSVAASGGYYIAAAANRIVANPGTITGSIGVIMQMLNVEELVHLTRVRPVTFTSGSFKDAGSPLRTLTEEEKIYFQSLIADMHQQFKQVVSESRHIPMEEVSFLADGRVFTGRDALQKKLVDELGGFEKALSVTAEAAGLQEKDVEYFYPEEEDKSLLKEMFDVHLPSLIANTLGLLKTSSISSRIPHFN